MLKLKDIQKDYRLGTNCVHALKGISITFRSNEFVSILGPSGCGKTTLLNIIGGLDHATSGELEIDGVSTSSYKDRDWDNYRNRKIGFVFQSYNLIPHQTILENVALALTISGVKREERIQRSKAILEKVGLADQINKKPNQLSGGQCQRVAIARALVNDPEILLADEPTGALDSKSSVQVMDLLAEIAKDRLVIMVTHNPELAEKYSTRTIRLLDGELVDDSNPIREEESMEVPEVEKTEDKKAKLSFLAAFRLSVRNLLSKWKRTALICFAGSIGIIGIGLVLAVSSGVSNYINDSEEDLLNSAPLTIAEKSYDLSSLMESMNAMSATGEVIEHTEDGVIQVDDLIGSLIDSANAMSNMEIKNDITMDYVDFVNDIDPSLYNSITLDYGIDITNNIFTGITSEHYGTRNLSASATISMYADMLSKTEMASLTSLIGEVAYPFQQITTGDDFLLSLYDVVATTDEENPLIHKEDELVLVLDGDGKIPDLLLGQYGFYTQEEFFNRVYRAMEDPNYDPSLDKDSFKATDFLGKEFLYYPNDAVYEKSVNPLTPFTYHEDASEISSKGLSLKVKTILRKKDNINYAPLDAGIYYSKELTERFLKDNKESKIVNYLNDEGKDEFQSGSVSLSEGGISTSFGITYQYDYYFNDKEYTNVTGYVGSGESLYSALLGQGGSYYTLSKRNLGGESIPNRIEIYPKGFDANDTIVSYLNGWNEEGDITLSSGKVLSQESREKITATDNLSLIFDMVGMITTIVTIALICFTALSLVVSTVMIAIITYISVIERVKEIGVIRSLGGRKGDVRNLFNAETFVIGGISGLFGVLVTYLASVIINAIVGNITGIYTIASLPIYLAVVLVLVSIVLTLVSGLIPANIGANKDPAVALRSE